MNYEACIPSWNGDNFTHIPDAYDAEQAAELHAKRYNEDDYPLMESGNNSIYVLVREVGGEAITLCRVTAEPSIEYYSYEVTELTCKQCGKCCRELILAGNDMYDDRYCTKACYQDWVKAYRKEYLGEG